MIKKTLLNFWLLLLCMIVGGASFNPAWGGDVTYDFTSTSNFYTTSDGDTHPSASSSNLLSSFYGSDRAAFSTTGEVYFNNSGYLMAKNGCTITLPTYSGKKITSIAITNSSTCSTRTSVSIKSGSSTASSAQAWNTTSKTYNYSIGASYQSSALTISVSSANAQITKIVITTEATHTLTYSATNGSIGGKVYNTETAVASGASVAEGGKVTLTAEPASGYAFSSWSIEGTGATLSSTTDNPTTFTMGTADATVTANFVVSATSDYITVSPTTKNITSSAGNVEFTISTDQTLDDDPTQFYTTADADETASKPDWITKALYDEGTLLLTVAANTGAARTAYFKVENGSVKSDVITITQAAKKYEIVQYTAPATAHGTITFSPESPVDAGAEVTLTATPASGYSFTADS